MGERPSIESHRFWWVLESRFITMDAEQLELFNKVNCFTENTQMVSEEEIETETQLGVEEFLKKEEIHNVTMSSIRVAGCCLY